MLLPMISTVSGKDGFASTLIPSGAYRITLFVSDIDTSSQRIAA